MSFGEIFILATDSIFLELFQKKELGNLFKKQSFFEYQI